ncbi:MAG: 2-amino-4-hydroxy-6-hydroxymethyldihydropteridine diphosphokinase [Duncaniella sp.]|nr:2-amino-4-hydroxy-6-hydroxymethyldihydropteridine diphosphokinase [Duncaniella sp.]
MTPLTPCTIGLGSNTPDKAERIEHALNFLKELLSDCSASDVYESEAFNGVDAPYMNAVVHGHSPLSYEKTLACLKDYEEQQGRRKEEAEGGVVSIDLDLVIWDFHIKRPKDFERHYFNHGYAQLLAHGAFQEE